MFSVAGFVAQRNEETRAKAPAVFSYSKG